MAVPSSIPSPVPSSFESRALPKGFRLYFYDSSTGETLACPRDYQIETVGRGHFYFVKNGESYSVDLEENTCTCPDYMIRRSGGGKGACKHLRLARALGQRGGRSREKTAQQ